MKNLSPPYKNIDNLHKLYDKDYVNSLTLEQYDSEFNVLMERDLKAAALNKNTREIFISEKLIKEFNLEILVFGPRIVTTKVINLPELLDSSDDCNEMLEEDEELNACVKSKYMNSAKKDQSERCNGPPFEMFDQKKQKLHTEKQQTKFSATKLNAYIRQKTKEKSALNEELIRRECADRDKENTIRNRSSYDNQSKSEDSVLSKDQDVKLNHSSKIKSSATINLDVGQDKIKKINFNHYSEGEIKGEKPVKKLAIDNEIPIKSTQKFNIYREDQINIAKDSKSSLEQLTFKGNQTNDFNSKGRDKNTRSHDFENFIIQNNERNASKSKSQDKSLKGDHFKKFLLKRSFKENYSNSKNQDKHVSKKKETVDNKDKKSPSFKKRKKNGSSKLEASVVSELNSQTQLKINRLDEHAIKKRETDTKEFSLNFPAGLDNGLSPVNRNKESFSKNCKLNVQNFTKENHLNIIGTNLESMVNHLKQDKLHERSMEDKKKHKGYNLREHVLTKNIRKNDDISRNPEALMIKDNSPFKKKGIKAESKNKQNRNRQVSHKELGEHCTKDDAWIAIKDIVYDVTTYAKQTHPGGNIIYKSVGGDGTDLFNKYHKYVKVENILKDFRIGLLQKD